MDRPYDFLRRPRTALLPLGLSGPGVATALAEELFPIRRDDAFGTDEQNAPLRAAPRRAAADAGRRSAWCAPRIVRAMGG